MCKQFMAQTIYKTTSPAIYDGYINEDFPVGSFYCEDALGDLYAYSGPTASSESNWPKRKKNGIPLFRDYWWYVQPHKESNYTMALLAAGRKIVSEVSR